MSVGNTATVDYKLYTENWFSKIMYFVSRECGLFKCAACSAGVYPLCYTCFGQFIYSTPSCSICNKFSEKGLLHPLCQSKRAAYNQTISCFEYEKTVKYLLSAYKYKGCYHLIREIQLLIQSYFRLDPFRYIVSCFDSFRKYRLLLIPVPMSKNKLAERGFSPAFELAVVLGRYLRDNYECSCFVSTNILTKKTGSLAQAKKTRQQRLLTLAREYSLLSESVPALLSLKPQAIVVVDDVVTTGATSTVMLDVLSTSPALKSLLISVPLIRFSFAKVA